MPDNGLSGLTAWECHEPRRFRDQSTSFTPYTSIAAGVKSVCRTCGKEVQLTSDKPGIIMWIGRLQANVRRPVSHENAGV